MEDGGFTRAAERLHLTQSAVSAQIKRLEAQTGCTLLARSTRSVSLTPQGEILLEYARNMFALHEDVRVKLGFGRPIEGAVRVGASEGFLGGWLGELLRRFKLDNPAIELALHIDITGPLLDSLASGHLDIVFGILCGSGNADEILWREPLVWALCESATVDRTQPLPVAFFPEPCPLRKAAVAALNKSGARWRLACVSPSAAGTRAAASFGFGVTPTLRSQLDPGLADVGAELGLPALPLAEFAVWTTGQTRTAAVQQLLAAVRSDLHRARPPRMIP